ncbi:neuronal acetylcholine receptor subunit hypothetical protein [Limosa lapponica baueri]|uniref:Neuronal acetylcholine receptor subunit alpha-7 n=1 Tax=Limosa lapponica baueri TaxID=1758121 RepID=A0A2I0UPK9_LIMLA|nr:neuronal acetylcholine receptor subunit hypothetical protein [Limosa lapponica baueri]
MGLQELAVWLLAAAGLVRESLQGEFQRKLYKELLKNYNPLERPVANDSQPLTVYFTLSLMQIMDVLEQRPQDIKDNGLCYILQEFWSYSFFNLPTLGKLEDEKNQVLTTNIWLQMTDPKHAYGKRMSFYYAKWSEYWTDHYLQWNVSEYPGVKNVRFPDGLIWKPDILLYNSADERFDATFHTNVLVNSSGHCQYLPPGITVLLSLTVFMLLVAEIMPATSDSVPLIAQYFASTMIIVGLSVVVTVIVLQYHHHDPDGGKMPKWTRIILLNWCAWFLRMKRPGEDKVRPACQHKQRRCSLSSVEMNTVSGQQSSNGNMLYIGFRGLEGVHCTPTTDSGVICGRMTCSPTDEENLLHSGHPSEGDPDLAKILEEVRYIANRFRDQDEEEAVCNEWKFAASVVDRLCLMAFSVFTIICTIGILMSAPNFVEAVSKDFA